MESSNDMTSTVPKRTLNVTAKMPQVDSLKKLRSLLDLNHRSIFAKDYGKILKLLDIDVKVEAITALTQFYDTPMRCFTFQDFQLAPTLEEFAQILGYSLEKDNPYSYVGNYPSISRIAKILKVTEEKLKRNQKKGTTGFLQSFFEESAHELAKVNDWDAFMEVLALTIFGVVLFPSADGIIDLAAIDVFLAFKEKKNPTHAMLANVYYTLNYCHEKKGKRIICCLPVLYIWLVNHMYDNRCQRPCPIDDFNNCDVKEKTKQEWAHRLVNLNEKTVLWYPRRRDINEVIYQCGTFPNVPLMGTRGCINYNPALALRQLGYTIRKQPPPMLTTPFVLYDMGLENLKDLRRVRKAWDKVTRKGKLELGRRSCGAEDDYRIWVKKRVQQIKLPFHNALNAVNETPMQSTIVDEEVEVLKTTLLKAEEEKKSLQEELRGIRRVCEATKLKDGKKTILLERACKIAKVEETRRLKTESCLWASNKSLGDRRRERNEAREDNEQLKDLLQDSHIAERNARRKLEDLKQQLERVVTKYKKREVKEKQKKEETVAMYHDVWMREREKVDMLRNQVIEQKEAMEVLRHEGAGWMDRYEKLTSIANAAIEGASLLLREAEAKIIPFSTLIEIVDFIHHCQNLVEEMNKLTYRSQ